MKKDQFAARMLDMANEGFLTLMTSVGHQTGLFDAMAALEAAGSAEIAAAAKLNERYVREWLGAMVTGRMVEYDPEKRTYRLPAEHAASLTRAAGTGNMATMMQFLSCMGNVEQEIVGCFRKGGGLPYSAYDRFHGIMAELSGQIFAETLIQKTVPLVPGLPGKLQAGIDVLDVGCGSGQAINLMARAYPASRFTGLDFSPEGIAAGEKQARAWELANCTFQVADVADLDGWGPFDLITSFDTIHDQAQPAKVLQSIAGSLTAGGTYLMVDIAASSRLEENMDLPLAPYFYAISTLHCLSVSLGLQGEGLGTVWGEQRAREMLAQAGFTQVDVKRVDGDIINYYYIAKKS
ncbi:MAG: class I SAM-dependent methyltransferase [Acidobacteriota bacterium]